VGIGPEKRGVAGQVDRLRMKGKWGGEERTNKLQHGGQDAATGGLKKRKDETRVEKRKEEGKQGQGYTLNEKSTKRRRITGNNVKETRDNRGKTESWNCQGQKREGKGRKSVFQAGIVSM